MDTIKTFSYESDSSSTENTSFSGFEDEFSGFEDEFSGFEDEFSGFEDEFSGFEDELSESEYNSVDMTSCDSAPNVDQILDLSGNLDIDPYILSNTIVLSESPQVDTGVMEEDINPDNDFNEGEDILLLDSHKKELGRELTPLMAMMMTLPRNNDLHPDVIRLSKWLARRQVTIDEFNYVVGPLQRKICSIMNDSFEDYIYDPGDGIIIYVLRAAAEALAVRCVTYVGDPYITEQWRDTAMHIFVRINEGQFRGYGEGSNKLSSWIIHALGNPKVTLNQSLRHNMVLLYRGFVKILNHNRKEALESLIYSFSLLDRYDNSTWITVTSQDIEDIFTLHFTNTNYPRQLKSQYLYKFGQKIGEIVKIFKSNCFAGGVTMELMMALKPKELTYLTGLVKYVSDEAHIEFKKFKDNAGFTLIDFFIGNNASLVPVEHASSALLLIVRFFKEMLEDPLVLCETMMSIMDVLEAVVHLGWDFRDEFTYGIGSMCLKNANEILAEFCYEARDERNAFNMIKAPIHQEISKRHKNRIIIMRNLVSNEFLKETPMIYKFLHDN